MRFSKVSLYFQVSFATIVWGASYPLTKHLLTQVSPISVVFLRALIGALVLLLITRSRFTADDFRFPNLWRLAVLSVVGVSLQHYLQGYALTYTTAGNAGWLIGTAPIMVALLMITMGEVLSAAKALAFTLGFAGTMIVIFSKGGAGGVFALPSTTGDFIFLTSCVCWAFYVLFTKRWLTGWTQAKVTTATMVAALFSILPVWAAAGGPAEMARLDARGVYYALFLGVVASGFSYYFWNNSVEGLGAVKSSYFIYLEPFATLVSAYYFIGERVTWGAIPGGVAILAGVYFINAKDQSLSRFRARLSSTLGLQKNGSLA
ncbi:MAG: DMT family transporter [Elusimicrobiales bacterium]|nr:DMT family transporter [Elusimicrobiales bacterium]